MAALPGKMGVTMGERLRRFAAWAGSGPVFRDGLFVLLLVGLGWAAYYPSLRHVPRADQWCFLVDTVGHDDFLDVLAHSYSYNRTRLTCPGDTDLFRPVLFAVLAAEKAWLGGHMAAVQSVGLVLHLVICLLLFAVLKHLARLGDAAAGGPPPAGAPWSAGDYLPYVLTAFFALNPAVMELVVWAHLHGYLLFLALVMAVVLLVLKHAADPDRVGDWRSPALWAAWGLVLVSAFTYEMGQFVAVLAGGFVATSAFRRVGLLRAAVVFAAFAAVLPVYHAIDAHDRKVHEGRYKSDSVRAAVREEIFTRATVEHSARFAVYSVAQPFCPTYIWTSSSGGRLHVAEALWQGPRKQGLGPTAVVSAAVLVIGAGLAVAGLGRVLAGKGGPVVLPLLLALLLYGLYAAITVLGRMNIRPGPHCISSNSYYAYPGLLFALVAGFAAVSALGRTREWVRVLRAVAVIGLVGLTVHGAERVRRVNAEVAGLYGPYFIPLRAVDRFVDKHEHEPGFSFAVDISASTPIPDVYGVPVTTAVFGKWMTPGPRYRVAVRGARVIILEDASAKRR